MIAVQMTMVGAGYMVGWTLAQAVGPAGGSVVEPLTTGGSVLVAMLAAELLKQWRNKGSENGYAKAESVARVEAMAVSTASGVNLLVERNKTQLDISREMVSELRGMRLELNARGHDCPVSDRLQRSVEQLQAAIDKIRAEK